MDIKRAALVNRLKQFRGACKAYVVGSAYSKEPPTVPAPSSIAGKFITAFDDMANLWGQINTTPPTGFTGPLTLAGGYLLATFNSDLAAFRTASITYANSVQNASIAREKRNLLMAQMVAKLTQYRGAAVAKLTSGSALLATIPAVNPPAGSTPQPVTLSGAWAPASSSAVLTWTASNNPDLDHYVVRYHPGPKYKAAEEQIVDTVPAGTKTLTTILGLAAEGSVAWYKVYVVTKTGNERGSNAVKVIRG